MLHQDKTLAVLLTCFNRKDKTLQCLATLKKQQSIEHIKISIYLVDDGSSDGTSKAVSEQFPEVHILHGDGNLYWGGGMNLAMTEAMQKKYDFYLWLNDDVNLLPDAFATTLETYQEIRQKQKNDLLLGGVFVSQDEKQIAYGGWKANSKWHPLKFTMQPLADEPTKCTVLNGNLVLIAHHIAEKVGNIDRRFPHATGDFEYCLRAAKFGFESWVVAHYVGECNRNESKGTWTDRSLPLRVRYKKLLSIKGHPIIPRMVYFSKYGGLFWPFTYIWIYLRPLIDQIKK